MALMPNASCLWALDVAGAHLLGSSRLVSRRRRPPDCSPVVPTSSTSRVTDALHQGLAQSDALVQGFRRGLLIAAVYSAINILVGLLAPNHRPTAEEIAESGAV